MTEPYDCIPRRVSQDHRLSFSARGMLIYLLSMPEGWEINAHQIERANGITPHHRRKLFQELKRYGYLRLHTLYDHGRKRLLRSQWFLEKAEIAKSRRSAKQTDCKADALQNAMDRDYRSRESIDLQRIPKETEITHDRYEGLTPEEWHNAIERYRRKGRPEYEN